MDIQKAEVPRGKNNQRGCLHGWVEHVKKML